MLGPSASQEAELEVAAMLRSSRSLAEEAGSNPAEMWKDPSLCVSVVIRFGQGINTWDGENLAQCLPP